MTSTASDLTDLLAEVDAILPRLLRPPAGDHVDIGRSYAAAAHLIDRLGCALALYRDAELIVDALDPFARMHSAMALTAQAHRDAVELRARRTETELAFREWMVTPDAPGAYFEIPYTTPPEARP